jgi:hypothetical protein
MHGGVIVEDLVMMPAQHDDVAQGVGATLRRLLQVRHL